MKFIAILSFVLISLSAEAAWNEVECDGRVGEKIIRLEIEESFPNGSIFKRALLTVTENGSQKSHRYTVSRRTFGLNRWEYNGAGLRLDVDLWPDRFPRWGWSYSGTLLSSVLGNQYIRGFRCQFPNAM